METVSAILIGENNICANCDDHMTGDYKAHANGSNHNSVHPFRSTIVSVAMHADCCFFVSALCVIHFEHRTEIRTQ
jgi:hypothetical protein